MKISRKTTRHKESKTVKPQWIPQVDSHGCCIATLAMITNQTYEAVKDGFSSFDNTGVGEHRLYAYLAEHGYATAVKYPTYSPNEARREVWPPEPFADVHIVQVITKANTPHCVV